MDRSVAFWFSRAVTNMNFGPKQISARSSRSTAEALAIKDAALRATLDYLEYKNGPGEWFKDELAYRIHRMVKMAMEFPSQTEESQLLEFAQSDRIPRNEP